MSFNKTQSRVSTSLLTGHNTLRRHLHLMGLTNSPLCRSCGAEDETSAHFLCEFEALASLRHVYLGTFFLDPEDIKSLSPGAIWNFIKVTGLAWTGITNGPFLRPRSIGTIGAWTQLLMNQSINISWERWWATLPWIIHIVQSQCRSASWTQLYTWYAPELQEEACLWFIPHYNLYWGSKLDAGLVLLYGIRPLKPLQLNLLSSIGMELRPAPQTPELVHNWPSPTFNQVKGWNASECLHSTCFVSVHSPCYLQTGISSDFT